VAFLVPLLARAGTGRLLVDAWGKPPGRKGVLGFNAIEVDTPKVQAAPLTTPKST